MLKKILMSLCAAVLMSLGWIFPSGIVATVAVVGSFFGFVPLLKLQKQTEGVKFIRYVLLCFLVFNLISISWVGKSAAIGVFAAVGVYLVLFGAVMALYNYVWKRATKPLAYVVLVCGWIAAERLYMNGEISFPWLNIGNSFAQNPYIIQWIEYSGVSGLSLWALVVNLVTFEMLEAKKEDKKRFKIALGTIIVAPMLVSLIMFFNYKEPIESINVTVLQPNIDPYNEKFGGLTDKQQEDILVKLIESSPKTSQYLVAPETALDRGFYLDRLSVNSSIMRIQNVLKKEFPAASYVGGLTSYQIYPKSEYSSAPTTTARDAKSYFYDVYNSSIQIDTTDNLQLYHKAKLVIGVEMLPYHEYLGFINKFSVSLGGISGMLASSENAVAYTNSTDTDLRVGSAICYESLYGEYFSEFVRAGARAMFIITNDGWWGDTFGYHQHLMFARLRAIETRRFIARSANTGISAFINQRGEISKSLGWDERGVLNGDIALNKKFTFFVVFGDIIGRVSAYTLVLCLLYFVAYIRKKKDHII
ncbi:MAG: apolipoprotein N-acyltransferase [Rikenellaceae bacterium]